MADEDAYWDADDESDAVEGIVIPKPENRCQCAKHKGIPCHRAITGEDLLCDTCRPVCPLSGQPPSVLMTITGKEGETLQCCRENLTHCSVFRRPGTAPIHSRGLARGRRGPAAQHAEDLSNTLRALAEEHELDAEMGGDMTARPSGGMQRTLGDIRSLPQWRGDPE